MNPDDTVRTERALQDERERRIALEERVATLSRQVRIWRERAERAKPGRRIRDVIGRVRKTPDGTDGAPPRSPRSIVVKGGNRLTYPHMRVSYLADAPPILLTVGVSHARPITDGSVPPADLVVVELAALDALPHDLRRDVVQELSEPGQMPIVTIGSGDVTSPHFSDHHETLDAVTVFDPFADPLAAGLAGADLDDAGSVLHRRTAYRRFAPERILEHWLDACGVDYRRSDPHVTALLVTMRPDELPGAVEQFDGQTWGPRSLVIACHGFPDEAWASVLDMFGARPDTTMLRLSGNRTLGECLNDAAAAATGSVLAKWDDDDHYGPGYLEDAVNALRYSGCDVVVKAAQYLYIENRDVTLLRRPGAEETAFDGDASGGTYVFRRRVWEDAPFPHRDRAVDVKFLASARASGYGVYSNTRFDYAYTKRSAGSTWAVSDELMMAQGEIVWDGPPGHRVDAATASDD